MSILAQVLLSSQSNDCSERSSALHTLETLLYNDPESYLLNLSFELANPSNPSHVRQLSGILIKNLLQNASNDTLISTLWPHLPHLSKIHIRNNSLGTLASDDAQVRLICCQTVASIACIDIPLGEWPDLLNVLIINSTNTNRSYKTSAIRALGYICSGLSQESLRKSEINSILTAIADNLQQTESEMRITAIVAFRDSLKFVKDNIEDENERGVIMKLIYECVKDGEVRVRKEAMGVLCDLAVLYYDSIGGSMSEIENLSYFVLRGDLEEVGVLAIEFWILVADEEVDRLMRSKKSDKGYIKNAAKGIVMLVLEKMDLFEIDDIEWNIHKACAVLLASISVIISDSIFPLVYEYITRNLIGEDLKKKLSALVIIGSILEGVKNIHQLMESVFNPIIFLIRDPHRIVIETATWVLSKVCEFHPGYLISHQLETLLLSEILTGIQSSAKIATNFCWALLNLLSKGMPIESMSDNQIVLLLESLMQCSIRNEALSDSELLSAVYSSLKIMFESLSEIQLQMAIDKIPEFLDIFENSIDQVNTNDIQGHICELLNVLFGRSESGSIDECICDRFVNTVINSFKRRESVIQESLMALGSLAGNIQGRFIKYLDSIMPFVLWSVEHKSDMIQKSALVLISDLAVSLKHEFLQYHQDLVMKVIDILPAADRHFNVKIAAIVALADFSVSSIGYVVPHISQIFTYIESASEISLNLEESNVEVSKALGQLRETIVEFYSAVIRGMHEGGEEYLILNRLEGIVEYALRVVAEEFSPSLRLDYVVVETFRDICRYYPGSRIWMLKNDNVVRYLDRIKRREEGDRAIGAKEFAVQILNCIW